MPFLEATRLSVRCVKASAERTGDTIDDGETRAGFTNPAMEVTTFNRGFNDADFPVWEKIGAVVRLSYGIGELTQPNNFFQIKFQTLELPFFGILLSEMKNCIA